MAEPSLRVALAGGGTGGHIVPGLHVLERAHAGGARIEDLVWFMSGRPVEERVLGAHDLPGERVVLRLEPSGGGAPSPPALALRTPSACLRARRALARHRSDVLLGLGGFTALPAVLAARSLGIPVVLLEINAVRGRATRWLSPLAGRVLHAWRSSLPAGGGGSARARWIGPPVAPGLLEAGEPREEALAALGFDPRRPLLCVLGGSQGAAVLNRFVCRHGPALLEGGLQLLHQTGPGRRAEGLDEREAYLAVEYVDDMERVLRAGTLALCRGGASTLAEIAAVGMPAIVVPYGAHADGHQERNALELGEGARIRMESALDEGLARELLRLAGSEAASERDRMSRAARAALPRDSAGSVIEELCRACGAS
ncbi:MAG: UDP-N-acetylglucosamine--N-acetylmuramyl-(pentapeptide) pyrophosphoryl-undecaprenol N-acetylglucosamine transferase [Planctomycetota bacterium]|nr:UDP-N-acetylglucosamine--N-acetylmuramyl-(pentapeptide) pyrophosphoryl-undecaprenol N-acetylglucosamine transferase [Planctomycetota bacterium]MDP6764109.1 UDP-N-acetylglucosamine--N-acetylmuramyl-(pentapeptide) pyrophosphoryl-undecaprenol N-acetylglucosamine transferase [Planctomycetota bacterium]